jgi:hypothetical protein
MEDGAAIQPGYPAASVSSPATRASGSCQSCGSQLPGTGTAAVQNQHVLAFGKIRLGYPSESIEKQFAHVIGRQESRGKTDLQIVQDVLATPGNRYLARLACWTLDIMDAPAYVLRPKDPSDYNLLIDALRPAATSSLDVVIGEIAGLASPAECNNQQLPRVLFETAYIWDKEQLPARMPKPEKIQPQEFESMVKDVFDRGLQWNKGIGLDRAKNFVFLFYDKIYGLAAQKMADGYSLRSVATQPSPASGPHQLATVCLEFRHRQTDVTELYCCTVNCDGVFPYLVDPLRPTYGSSLG